LYLAARSGRRCRSELPNSAADGRREVSQGWVTRRGDAKQASKASTAWQSRSARAVRIAGQQGMRAPPGGRRRSQSLKRGVHSSTGRISASARPDFSVAQIRSRKWARAAWADGQGTRRSRIPLEPIVHWSVLGALDPPHPVTCDRLQIVTYGRAECTRFSRAQGLQFHAVVSEAKERGQGAR